MQIKKAGGKVYGANLSAAEKKAMDMEIQRQLAEYSQKHATELDAIILWQLHEQFGFGPTRLKRFYDQFAKSIDDLVKRYEMEEDDRVWLCTHMLQKYGIDLKEWERSNPIE